MAPLSSERMAHYRDELRKIQTEYADSDDNFIRLQLQGKWHDLADQYLKEGGTHLELMYLGWYDSLIEHPKTMVFRKITSFLKRRGSRK